MIRLTKEKRKTRLCVRLTKERYILGGGPGPSSSSLSSPRSPLSLWTCKEKHSRPSSSKSGPPAKRIRPGIFPTLVSSRNSAIAGTALSSPKSRRTDGAPPHPQSNLILCHSLLISGSHLLHLTNRWKRVFFSSSTKPTPVSRSLDNPHQMLCHCHVPQQKQVEPAG